METHLLGYHSFMSMYKWGIYRVQNLLQFRLFCFTDATWWWTWGNCTFIYLQLFVCCRVPRNVEAKITQWIRFQYAEELSDAQVHWRTNNLHWTRKLINLSFLYWSKAGQACWPCQVVANNNLLCGWRWTVPCGLQKRRILSDPSLPSEFRLSLARSLRHDLFFQVDVQFRNYGIGFDLKLCSRHVICVSSINDICSDHCCWARYWTDGDMSMTQNVTDSLSYLLSR